MSAETIVAKEPLSADSLAPDSQSMAGSAKRFESLDIARGIAILAVLGVHFMAIGDAERESLVFPYVWSVFQHGSLGVELFFVISGYCITLAAYQSFKQPKPASYFLVRRLKRIFPPYWAGMALFTLLGLVTVFVLKKSWWSVFPLTTSDWIANFFLLQGVVHSPDLNLVFWSLTIEFQFYLLIFLALLTGKREWFEPLLLITTVLTAFLTEYAATHPEVTLISVVPRWSSFAVGMLLMYWIQGNAHYSWIPKGMLAVFAGLLLFHLKDPWLDHSRGHISLAGRYYFCFAVLLLLRLAFEFDRAITSTKLGKLLAYTGIISYSLYLVHLPLGTRFFNGGSKLLPVDGYWWMFYFMGATTISFLAAHFFHRWVERPFMNAHPRQSS